jgi:Undecaprenyl-phosphate glucose phosphotransferase
MRDTYMNRVKILSAKTLNLTLILGFLIAFLLPRQYSSFFLFQCIGLFFLSELVLFKILYAVLKYRRSKGLHMNRALIVGEDETTDRLKNMIEINPLLGYQFAGFVSNNSDKPGWVGTSGQLAHLIKKHQIQMVFVSTSLFADQLENRKYLEICSSMCIRLRFATTNPYEINSLTAKESLGNIILTDPLEIPLNNWIRRLWKRTADVLISSFAIAFIFSWLFPLIAVLIKLSSRGPVFFVQKRTGLNKKTFNCIKFRSMMVNNEANSRQARKNDNRITPVGQFLRKTNLDELPQFFNVFMGQMSVVGPRPHMLRHTGHYSKLIDQYLTRHYVKPGVTGWAQVNGYRGETDELWKMQKRVDYDMDYIENWNFWWDLVIIWKTVFSVNAYETAHLKHQLANKATA